MNPDFSSGAFLSINKTQLSALPQAHFKGEIRVVDHEQGIIEAIAELRKSNTIGFDTETGPSFRKGQINSVALVQLSTRSVCFLFRINITGLSQHIIDLLEDENILKIGLSVHDDFHNLNKITHISPKGFIDLQNYVKEYEIADNSLSRIYGIVFGERVSKGQRLTNWEAEYLTPSQQCYADHGCNGLHPDLRLSFRRAFPSGGVAIYRLPLRRKRHRDTGRQQCDLTRKFRRAGQIQRAE